MNVLFVASVTPITSDLPTSTTLYRSGLGLALEGDEGGYQHSEQIGGVKHFGVWSLAEAAQSCFGRDEWPPDLPVPQATIEFERADVAAVDEAVVEMKARGLTFVHDAKLEGWGQTVARFLSPEGPLLGLSHTRWMH